MDNNMGFNRNEKREDLENLIGAVGWKEAVDSVWMMK
jgi:hypothetical protein